MPAETQNIPSRSYKGDEDFWKIRDLVLETYSLTPVDFNWEIRRIDGWRFHREDAEWLAYCKPSLRLWETTTGRLVGVVHNEGHMGYAYLELRPDFRCLEEEMFAWAEENLAEKKEDGSRQLGTFVWEYDIPRRRLLQKRGYQQTPHYGVTRRIRFGSTPLPQKELAKGYILRTTRPGDIGDWQRIADVLNASFNRNFHTAEEYRIFTTQSPSFRHDLNLVAEASDGSFAAHVGVTYDEVNRRGIFEPVCTHSEHRRHGLASTLIYEGMRRLKALGATDAYVGTGDSVPANELYDSVGFTEIYKGYTWQKVF